MARTQCTLAISIGYRFIIRAQTKKNESPLFHPMRNWNIATRDAFSPCRHCISSSHVTASYRTVIGNAKHTERAKFAVPNTLTQTPVARYIWTKCVSRYTVSGFESFFFLFFVRSLFYSFPEWMVCARAYVLCERRIVNTCTSIWPHNRFEKGSARTARIAFHRLESAGCWAIVRFTT